MRSTILSGSPFRPSFFISCYDSLDTLGAYTTLRFPMELRRRREVPTVLFLKLLLLHKDAEGIVNKILAPADLTRRKDIVDLLRRSSQRPTPFYKCSYQGSFVPSELRTRGSFRFLSHVRPRCGATRSGLHLSVGSRRLRGRTLCPLSAVLTRFVISSRRLRRMRGSCFGEGRGNSTWPCCGSAGMWHRY
jgi:hypothetical protein